MKLIALQDGHNASAAYLCDGEILFAIQEERISRVKNTPGFPANALAEIFQRLKLSPTEIDSFIFTDAQSTGGWKRDQGVEYVLRKHRNMFQKPDAISRLRRSLRWLYNWPLLNSLVARVRTNRREHWLAWRAEPLRQMGIPQNKIKFLDHHTCHAAAAAHGWGLKEKFAVITSDGAGDGLSGSISVFENGTLKRVAEISVDDSIARLYASITCYLGMAPLEHEYKVMGLAPYAEGSKAAQEIKDYFLSLFEFDADGLTYHRKKGVNPVYTYIPSLEKTLRFKRFDHIAAGTQMFVEEFVAEWVRRVLETLKIKNLALSGGLFMNVKLNKRIMELPEVEKLFVFPSCGDETNVFGALWHEYSRLTGKTPLPLKHLYGGRSFSNDEVVAELKSYPFKNKIVSEQSTDIDKKVAELISQGEIVARFAGPMEFGARALGNRSILANPANWDSVKTINKMIKNRDFWMPFAPSCTNSDRYFINPKKIPAPYMILTFDVRREKVDVMRAALHPYDDTARPQEVLESMNPRYFRLIKEYERFTGESVILNTSFNLHGFPIVYTPHDALHVFDNSGLKYLALEDFLVSKV